MIKFYDNFNDQTVKRQMLVSAGSFDFMKYFPLILMLLFSANFAFAQNPDWVGVYTFNEESWGEDRVRTTYWFRLEVKAADGKLVGIYSDGMNGETTRRFQLAVKTEDQKARFYYESWLPRIEGLDEKCTESEFAGGELLFEFEESTKDGKPVIYTIWQKMNLAVRTETGSSGTKSVFFRKAKLMR